VLQLLAVHAISIPVMTLGVGDRIYEQASQKRLREIAGLTETRIIEAVHEVRDRRSSLQVIEQEVLPAV